MPISIMHSKKCGAEDNATVKNDNISITNSRKCQGGDNATLKMPLLTVHSKNVNLGTLVL